MFKLPEEVKKGIEDYKQSLKQYKDGRLSTTRFKGIRVPWGIYSHRGQKVFMTRIRVPAGIINARGLIALAEAAEKFGKGLLHITTRQDIQIHDVKIEDTIKVMELLKEHDLSPRGGGGNTVRNVIACPLSGLNENSIFDVKKYAVAVSEYLLRQETSFTLPRKFKIAFSGCASDCAGCLINDLGFLAKIKDGEEGFKVFVGGGLGANPRIGKLLEEFLLVEDLGYCISAVKNIYYKNGDRHNKHHNRLRFLIEDMGVDEFNKLYKEEFKNLKENEHISLRRVDFPQKEEISAEILKIDEKDYKEFLRYNVIAQKQKGYAIVELRIPRGDITSKALTQLADLEKDFSGIQFRTSQNQNLYICWVKNSDIYDLFKKLKTILKDFLYPSTLLDIVACKGALTCNLGLCNSPALVKELEEVIKKNFIGKKVFKNLNIKINGCPNACGHQPIGKLSFFGLTRRVDNRPVPFYKFLVGGRKEAELTRFAEDVGLIPAKNVPNFLKAYLEKIEERIEQSKDIGKEVLKDYSYVPTHSEDKNFYIDWGRKEQFSLAGLGQGECGAGVLDMIEADLTDARIALEEAKNKDYSCENIKKVLFYSARALLVVRGKEPKTEHEAISDFKKEFIDTKIASDAYADINIIFKDSKGKFDYAKGFFDHVNELYKRMDSSFNFPQEKSLAAEEITEKKEKPTSTYDLKGTPCPLNYVKAKLFLEDLNSGDILEILLDEGEPITNVPRSLKEDGHKILNIEKQDGFYKLLVRKK